MLFRNSRKLRISLIVLILRRNDTKGPSIFDLEEGRGGRRNRDWTAPTSSVQAMAVAPGLFFARLPISLSPHPSISILLTLTRAHGRGAKTSPGTGGGCNFGGLCLLTPMIIDNHVKGHLYRRKQGEKRWASAAN